MQETCTNPDFFAAQSDLLRRSIEQDKWFLSEQAGHDVGMDTAKEHFFSTHFYRFAIDFRRNYCTTMCPKREDCMIAQRHLLCLEH